MLKHSSIRLSSWGNALRRCTLNDFSFSLAVFGSTIFSAALHGKSFGCKLDNHQHQLGPDIDW